MYTDTCLVELKFWFIVSLAIVIMGIGFFAMDKSASTVTIGSAIISAEVADTQVQRMRGLSGREGLAPDSGMLFIFETDGKWGIWMKDMRFSLDIIWADASGNIVTIERGAALESYPKAFEPSAPARYVLEVPAGFSERHGITEGMKLEFK